MSHLIKVINVESNDSKMKHALILADYDKQSEELILKDSEISTICNCSGYCHGIYMTHTE